MYIDPSGHSAHVTTYMKTEGNTNSVTFDQAIEEMSENGEISFDRSDLDSTGTELMGTKIILPTMANVQTLTNGMNDIMNDLYAKHGLEKDPPVELSYSYAENKVKVSGNRDDAAEIEELINSDPETKEYTRTYLAISETAMAIQESIEFQEEYRNSNNPEAVVAKYSYLFDQNRHHAEATYMFGSEPSLLSDGVVYTDLYDFMSAEV